MNAKHLCRWLAVLAAVGTMLFMVFPAFVVAGPLFVLPGGPVHLPGFVVHLPPIGPVPLPPGGVVGPIPYGDGMPNPVDPHHWEIELNNAGPAAFAQDVVITAPVIGVAFAGNIFLAPGSSAYWDIHYPDIPEVGGFWTFLATNPPAGPPGVLIDSSVLEYNFPLVGAGPAGPLFLGPGGFGPLLGMPPILIGITPPVPEPATITLALCGGVALVGFARRRKQRAKTIV